MRRAIDRLPRPALGLCSVAAILALYWVASLAYARPDLLPPPRTLVTTLATLTTGRVPVEAASHEAGHVHGGGHAGPTEQLGELLQQELTLPRSLAVSALRVLFGLAVGGPLGILLGLGMGWSRRVDDYVHPVFVLLRSVPPLALITYVMLWFGHGEAHRLIPITYAVAVTIVIPTYHGVADVAPVYAEAARSLGARGWLLLRRVVLPAAAPFVLAGLRYALLIAWMTTVGVEMLMADDGLGRLLVGGGLWASRLTIRVDPAVVIAGVLALSAAGWAMDAAARLVADRLTAWRKERARW